MGYKQPHTIYRLDFADPKYEGLEVRVRSMPIGQYLRNLKTLDRLEGATSAAELTAEDIEEYERLLRNLADRIVSWNLEDEDGNPLPSSYEVLADQEFGFLMDIFDATNAAIAGVSDDLGKGSGSGETSPEELELPMEPLSPSRAS